MTAAPTSGRSLRLCLLMFLQFFIWGVWYVPMWKYLTELGFSGAQVGVAYAATGLGAMISPFLVGMIADRFFPSQVVLGVLHLLGGGFLLLAARTTEWNSFYGFLLLHLICYMPTLAMANSVLFQSLEDPQKQAPPIRTLGTIGWIVSGLVVGGSFLSPEGFRWQVPELLGGDKAPESWKALGMTHLPLLLGAGASFLLGLYSFTLPNTPPKLKGRTVGIGDVLGLRALGLLKDPSFAIFIACSLLLCIPLSFYFQLTNGFLSAMNVANSEGVMTLGQVSEILFLLAIPFFFRRLGVKWMLMIGMAFWVLRYLLFANATADLHVLLFLGVLFHGICYDFFFFTGQLYVDQRAPEEVRSGAQGFIAFVTLGVGMFLGGILAGNWTQEHTVDGLIDWPAVWYFPAGMSAVVLVVFAFLFRDRATSPSSAA
jgi:nucleoside transporter